MSNNPHHEAAADLIGAESTAGGSTFLDPNTQGMMLAQAEATLALAYEQRTANLIALWSMPEQEADGLESAAGKDRDGVEKDIWRDVAQQIVERLGLS